MQEHKTNKEIQKLFFSIVLQYVIYYFGVRLKVGPIAISGMLLVRVIDIYCRECGSFYGPPSLIMTNGICNSVHTRDTYSDLVKQKKKQTDCSIFLFIWQYIAIHVNCWHYIIPWVCWSFWPKILVFKTQTASYTKSKYSTILICMWKPLKTEKGLCFLYLVKTKDLSLGQITSACLK